MDLGIVGLWFLAVPSLTHLINKDLVTDWLRQWAYRRNDGAGSTLTYFLECPWCVSLWVALGTAWYPLLLTGWSWWLYPLLVLAVRYWTGVLESTLDTGDGPDIEIE